MKQVGEITSATCQKAEGWRIRVRGMLSTAGTRVIILSLNVQTLCEQQNLYISIQYEGYLLHLKWRHSNV